MKVYFGTSPRIKDKDPELILVIYRLIEKFGYGHTSKWVKEVSSEKFYAMSDKELTDHHRQTEKAIKSADICVFEASTRSLSVGYLTNFALENGKVVIVLSQNKDSLLLFRSTAEKSLISVVYDKDNLDKKLKEALNQASGQADVRFNFFIQSSLLSYLDWVSNTRRIPRSVFLRDLIEKEMKKDKEYKV